MSARSRPTFLEADAGRDQLLRAIASNHRQWMTDTARVWGGELHRAQGATWIYSPGPRGEVTIPFPQIDPAVAGDVLDAILAACWDRQPLQQIGCWSLHSGASSDLG